jgi:riboflavin kinase/FMN adenylyltransferase
MHLLRSLSELSRFRSPISIALGVFDGVHLGHQVVIGEAVRQAREANGEAVILTFHPHPAKILRPIAAPLLLTTEQQDYELFSARDVDACVIMDFTAELSRCSAADFLNKLGEAVPTLHFLVVGPDWHFGYNREGNFKFLRTWALNRGIKAAEVAAYKIHEEVVSSTWIRKLLMNGDVNGANTRLGRSYQIIGRVVAGNRLGSRLGFPTANLDVENELIPASGVYAARALIEGEVFAAAVNIGTRPTLSNTEKLTVEAHLLDFNALLYGHHLRLDFLARLRDERKFQNMEDLKNQIAIDIQATRRTAYL